MNNLEAYLVKLLQGHLSYDNKPVYLVRQFSEAPNRPVITLDTSPGVSTQATYADPSRAEKYIEYHATVNINLWCDTEEQREELTNQILSYFYLEINHHHMYCTNYNREDDTCQSLDAPCPAVEGTVLHKYHCPEPELYDYQSLQGYYNIIKGTLDIAQPFHLDEVNEHPPLLRSIFKCECQYSVILEDDYKPVRDVHLFSDRIEIK